jgi:riboflavin kinase/FMN adenylyltransferase
LRPLALTLLAHHGLSAPVPAITTPGHMTSDTTAPARRFTAVRDPQELPATLAEPVVAIGNFDGVHRGHKAVVSRARLLAEKLGRPLAVLTFEPHPADYFAGRSVVFRMTPQAAKAKALERLDIDGLIVFSFDASLAGLTREEFVSEILLRRLAVSGVVVGYDFHFGKGRTGSPEYLRDAGRQHGFEVEVIGKIVADADGSLEAVHSGNARKALIAGDVARARALLGHEYFVIGEVVHGQKLGRTLGFPTANLVLDPSNQLRHGIYAVRIVIDGVTHGGVASWGRRPTVDNGAPLLEIFVFDFAGNLYGKEVEVDFVSWIRGEEKFDSLEALKDRIALDVEEARQILAG